MIYAFAVGLLRSQRQAELLAHYTGEETADRVLLRCLSKVRTASCLVAPRLEDVGVFPSFAGRFARLLALAGLALLDVLLCDILGSLSVATASDAVTTEAPQWRRRQRGGIQLGPSGPLSAWRH